MTHLPFDARLAHLLRAAAKVFAERGYHSTPMRQVAQASGMSLAGMYYYVKGKDDLLFRIQERCLARVLAGAEEAVGTVEDPLERLDRFIRHHVTFFAAHMDEMKVLSHEAGSLRGVYERRIRTLKQRYVDLLVAILSDCLGSGAVRVDARIAAYALFGMMNWIYTWYDPDGPVTPEALAAQFSEIFQVGIAAPAVAAGAAVRLRQGAAP